MSITLIRTVHILTPLLIIFLFSCGKVTPPDIPPEQGKDYYPLKEIERIYKVDSITYDLNGIMRVQDSSSTFMRHRVKWIDSSWVTEVAFRADDSTPWTVRNFIPIIQQGTEIIELNNGAPLRKLVWPLEEGSEWEETAMVSADYTITIEGEPIQPFSVPWLTEVTSFGVSHSLRNETYEGTLHKQMVDEDLLIEYRKAEEIYARDIGLIYAHYSILDTQCEHKGGDIAECIDDPWVDKANRGYQVTIELISWQ